MASKGQTATKSSLPSSSSSSSSLTTPGAVDTIMEGDNKLNSRAGCDDEDPKELLQFQMRLSNSIRRIIDYPREGCDFPDITTLFLNPQVFEECINRLANRYRQMGVTHVVSAEVRGLVIGAPLAVALRVPFIPIRKSRKLPGETVGVHFHGYRFGVLDRYEIHRGHIPHGARVVICDDCITTGRTLVASCRLIRKVNATVVECAVRP